ncbi:colanic acid biosynthesis glycosyltransferase WcaI [Sinomicrobium pectinilyticum]|uniref:Colanic acid biosynthesis glycosyltransferase WcaI n=1 Tax=Sinomicrobium pectinilyticum TaxID=1084421 RepID=A0A3N0E6T9_SINP1|nr:WcaI family glycosyltransferase [Sinomicrobium pectinilyticum]RNL83558.1 colanic acid biosynthesis glycosyltransferase WcaI [Sinomicrobium pectinilyticum]
MSKKKTITLIGVNYFPEDTAIGLYSTQMMDYLGQSGYKVNVITGFPYYPQWKIKDSYISKKTFVKEEKGGETIYRYKQYVPSNPSFFKRILHLGDFTLGSLWNILKIKETDLVIAVVPFTSAVFLGWVLKKKTKSKLWVHIQDFEFDAALQAGVTKQRTSRVKSFFFSKLFELEKFLFSKAEVASTISYTMIEKLKTKTGRKTEIVYLPNWIDADKIDPNVSNRHPYLSSDKFKILYSGNIGDKQDWDNFLSFVKKLNKDKYEVAIVGDGAKKDWLINEIKALNYVYYYPPVPFGELSDLLCSADLHVLFQKEDVIDTVMPSKLLGMMASGKPSLITGNNISEVRKVLTESGGGYYVQPKEMNKLLDCVHEIFLDKKKAKFMGESARKYVVFKYSKDKILKSLDKKIDYIIDTIP